MNLSSAHRSRSKNMATALNQRQPNPFDNDNAAPSSNIGLGIGGAGFRAGGNKNEAYASHYRRSDAGHAGPPSEALTSLSAHRSQNAPRPPAQLPKQRSIYQDFPDQTANKSQSNVKNSHILNQYSNEIGPDGIPGYANVPGSSQSKKRFINNDMVTSFYGESSNGMNGRGHYQPSGTVDSNNQRRQMSREGMRKMSSTLEVRADGNGHEVPSTHTAEPFSASASPFKMN